MRYAFACLLMAFLTGCATTAQMPAQVLVPVAAECPAPTLPPRPRLPLADLPDNAKPDETARAAVASLQIAMDYAEALEQLLGAYKKNDK